jgi:hypothetical protein
MVVAQAPPRSGELLQCYDTRADRRFTAIQLLPAMDFMIIPAAEL